jgi:hypothetical protein
MRCGRTRGIDGGSGGRTAGRWWRGEPATGHDHAGAFAGPVGSAVTVDVIDGEHDPLAAVAEAAWFLCDGSGDLDSCRSPDPAEKDAASDRRRSYRGGRRAGGQQGAEHQHADHGAAAALVSKARDSARSQAGHRQAEGCDGPGCRDGEPRSEQHSGRGGRRQHHSVHVRVCVAVTAGRAGIAAKARESLGPMTRTGWGAGWWSGSTDWGRRRAGCGRCRTQPGRWSTRRWRQSGSHVTVTRSLSWSKRRWPMPGTSRSSSTVVKGWAER